LALPVNAAREAAECTTAEVQSQQLRRRTVMKANRIQELAEQARLHAYYEAQASQIQKFAELIIRECLDIGYKHKAYASMGEIMEHFGVTE